MKKRKKKIMNLIFVVGIIGFPVLMCVDAKRMQEPGSMTIGSSDFKQLLDNKAMVVDKTQFLKDILDSPTTTNVITRPSSFGKSVILSMLRHFLSFNESSSETFKPFLISRYHNFCDLHQNKYPVLTLNFAASTNSLASFLDVFRSEISKAYEEHAYLKSGGALNDKEKSEFDRFLRGKECDENFTHAITMLAKFLHRAHSKKVILLIDNYDKPIEDAFEFGYLDKLLSVYSTIMACTLRGNEDFRLTVITGVADALFSSLDNVTVFSVLDDKYAEYFGFTEYDVKKLIDRSPFYDKEAIWKNLKDWCGGYNIGTQLNVFNPMSVMMCLNNKGMFNQHSATHTRDEFHQLFLSNGVLPGINAEMMLKMGMDINKTVTANISYSDLKVKEDAFWSLMLHLGYVTPTKKVIWQKSSSSNKSVSILLRIPNAEIRSVFEDLMYYKNVFNIPVNYSAFIDSLINCEAAVFDRCFPIYLNKAGNFYKLPEKYDPVSYGQYFSALLRGLEKYFDPLQTSLTDNYFTILATSKNNPVFMVFTLTDNKLIVAKRQKIKDIFLKFFGNLLKRVVVPFTERGFYVSISYYVSDRRNFTPKP